MKILEGREQQRLRTASQVTKSHLLPSHSPDGIIPSRCQPLFFVKIAKHLLCENLREFTAKSQCLGVRKFLTEMYSVYVLSECQFVGWYCSFNRYISSFSVFSFRCIGRQGQWFAGLDMSLTFANRALQSVSNGRASFLSCP